MKDAFPTPLTAHPALRLLAVLATMLGAPSVGQAQVPSQSQVQQLLQQNPEMVRQRLQQSGPSPDQIRDRLQAAGYSRTLLDPFITGAPETAARLRDSPFPPSGGIMCTVCRSPS